MNLVERLAEKWTEIYRHDEGADPVMPQADTRWWLNAIADEAEARVGKSKPTDDYTAGWIEGRQELCRWLCSHAQKDEQGCPACLDPDFSGEHNHNFL